MCRRSHAHYVSFWDRRNVPNIVSRRRPKSFIKIYSLRLLLTHLCILLSEFQFMSRFFSLYIFLFCTYMSHIYIGTTAKWVRTMLERLNFSLYLYIFIFPSSSCYHFRWLFVFDCVCVLCVYDSEYVQWLWKQTSFFKVI